MTRRLEQAEWEKEEAAACASSKAAVVHQQLGDAIGLAAQQLQAPAPPEASLVEQLGTVFDAGREWIRRGIRVGVRSTFAVHATHYHDIDFLLVSTSFVLG